MRNIWIIARREYRLYFAGPVAYVVAFLFMLILGYFFYSSLRDAIAMSFYQSFTPSSKMLVNNMVIIFLFTMPALTMRLFAEEQRSGTIELLLTAPVRDWELVLGKWLGGFLFSLTLLAGTLIYAIVLHRMTTPGLDLGMLFTNYLGLALMLAAFTALGVAISSLFNNQIAAFFASLAVVLLVWLIRPATTATAGGLTEVINSLNFVEHYMSFYNGAIDLRDIVYYLSVTALGLFVGSLSLDSRRWR